MTRLATSLLVIGILVLALAGCDPFFQFNPPDGSDGDAGEKTAGQTMFFDDFEGGAKSAWATASGTWRAEGGLYSVQEQKIDWLNTYVKTRNSKQWRNYAIDVDLKNVQWDVGFNDQEAAIILRAQDDLNKVKLKLSDDNMNWVVIVNDERKSSGGGVSPGLTGRAHLRVEVQGDTYTAYVRQGEQGRLVKRTSFTDETFSKGMPGLSVFYKVDIDFDNFKVTSLEN